VTRIIAVLGIVLAAARPASAENMIGRQSQNEGMAVVPAPASVKIDGDLSDWDWSGRIWVFVDKNIRNRYSVEAAAMWDAQNLYLAAVKGFYRFLLAERLASPHIPRIEQWIAERARKVPRRRPQFPREEIEQLIAYAESLPTLPVDSAGASLKSESSRRAAQQRARLRNMRDRALILLLADTGLRVSEACSLTLEDVNFFEGHLHVLGKGDKDDLVRVSQRALNALRDYLHERQAVGLSSPVHRGRPLSAGRLTPLFVRHDRAAGKGSPTPLDPSTAWDIIRERATEVLGGEAAHRIHPHSFRHYFVTIVLLATNNIEKARRLARHRSITTTQLYAEVDPELDRDYHEIFNTSRRTKV